MESEAERAAFYQAHKDDPDVWGELERPARRGPKKRLTATITVRFSPDESDLIRREAERTGSNYSEVVRRAVRALAGPVNAQVGNRTEIFTAGPPQRTQTFEFRTSAFPVTTSTGEMSRSAA